jgi:eukaryotic-like serine/threonine-protein kinase
MVTEQPARIGRYDIVRRLGRSMTDVYLALDAMENRQVALKIVRTGGDRTSQLIIEAERRGADIQRQMQALDPRVVEIYEIGEEDGYFFVAMQYVEGRNLASILREDHVVPATRAAVIALEVCEQLVKFHSGRTAVVHGDIKPSNILLGVRDTVRLLDFGIAKTLRADGSPTAHDFGSPSYCSPERLTRSEVDQQSDLWAVGATLYEMLTGKPPYQAGNTRKLEGIIRSKRPPGAISPTCPRGLRFIAMKALAPTAARRYHSAVEMQRDLQLFLEGKTTQAERDLRQGWNASATIEAAREAIRKATRTVKRANYRWRFLGAAAWFLAGMALWVGGTLGWQQLLARSTPTIPTPADPLPVLYSSEANRVFDAYRASTDPDLQHFDWGKAEVLLQRAAQIGGADDRMLGRLALARGYASLERLDAGQYPTVSAAQWSATARDLFEEAVRRLPHDPDPHLALARIYTYWQPDIEHAMAEFRAAEQLGAVLSRREMEQQGDAYRLLALREAAPSPFTAWQDSQMARELYQRVRGFDRVEQSLQQLNSITAPKASIRRVRHPVRPTPHSRRRSWR